MKIYTSSQLAEIICRQYELPPNIGSLLQISISRLNDRKLAKECEKSGFSVYRIRAGQFIMQKIN
jgi:hypothetical protein